jgi:hypothetical protein
MSWPRSHVARLSSVIVASVCALVAGVRIVSTYIEYYGDGPPYYGRSVNMDKWTNPTLDLVVSLGFVALCAVVICRGVGGLRRARHSDS